MLAHVSCFSR